jgi:hypothetical protein
MRNKLFKKKNFKKKVLQVIITLVFLNLDLNTFCETIENLSINDKNNNLEESWEDWAYNNKGKILILTSVACICIIFIFFFLNGDNNPDSNLIDFEKIETISESSFLNELPYDNNPDSNLIDFEKIETISESSFLNELPYDNNPDSINNNYYDNNLGIGTGMSEYFNMSYIFLQSYIDYINNCTDRAVFCEIYDKLIKLETGQLVLTQEEFYDFFLDEELKSKIKVNLLEKYIKIIQKLGSQIK